MNWQDEYEVRGQRRDPIQSPPRRLNVAHLADEPVVGVLFLLVLDALDFEVLADAHELDPLSPGPRSLVLRRRGLFDLTVQHGCRVSSLLSRSDPEHLLNRGSSDNCGR